MILKSEHKYTLLAGTPAFDSSAGRQTNRLMAAVSVCIVPMMPIFVLLQRQLVSGIEPGAVKG